MTDRASVTRAGNVVMDYYSGRTHIVVCDDHYRNMTALELRTRLDKIAKKVRGPYVSALREKEIKEKDIGGKKSDG